MGEASVQSVRSPKIGIVANDGLSTASYFLRVPAIICIASEPEIMPTPPSFISHLFDCFMHFCCARLHLYNKNSVCLAAVPLQNNGKALFFNGILNLDRPTGGPER